MFIGKNRMKEKLGLTTAIRFDENLSETGDKPQKTKHIRLVYLRPGELVRRKEYLEDFKTTHKWMVDQVNENKPFPTILANPNLKGIHTILGGHHRWFLARLTLLPHTKIPIEVYS